MIWVADLRHLGFSCSYLVFNKSFFKSLDAATHPNKNQYLILSSQYRQMDGIFISLLSFMTRDKTVLNSDQTNKPMASDNGAG